MCNRRHHNSVVFIILQLATVTTSMSGYHSADGLHPNYRGTSRLATNLGLTPAGQEVQSTKTRTTQNHGDRRSTRRNERSQCRQTDNERHTVRRYHDHDRRDSTPTNAALHSSSTPCCYFCLRHVKQNCRHGRKLQCHTCQTFGHKSILGTRQL